VALAVPPRSAGAQDFGAPVRVGGVGGRVLHRGQRYDLCVDDVVVLGIAVNVNSAFVMYLARYLVAKYPHFTGGRLALWRAG
jgi:hypothetical protein